MINTCIKQINQNKLQSSLFSASPCKETGYNRIWIRDNIYISLSFEAIDDKKTVENIYHALINILLKYEYKIDCVIKEKPTEDYKYLHPIYTTNTEEIKEEWGWKQNDAIGALLFKIGELQKNNYKIIRNKNDTRIIQKLVQYLDSIKYWEDEDNGMWEENKEIHASSVGACVAGLKSIKNIINIFVPKNLIIKGENSLIELLPNESKTKKVDLSLLSLIYPYNIVNKQNSNKIIKNIEKYLLKEKGIIRYIGDKYYQKNRIEASWTMGLPWMAIICYQNGDYDRYTYYMKKTFEALNAKLELSELYIEDKKANNNSPLCWSQSLLIKALML